MSARRLAACLVPLLAALAASGPAAAAPIPPGPRLAVVELGGKPDRLVLKSLDAEGADPLRIAGGGKGTHPLPNLLSAPSWSADGGSVAFSGQGGKVEGSAAFALDGTQVYVAAADGSSLRSVPETTESTAPVFSPDGQTIAFERQRRKTRSNATGGEDVVYESTTVWLADLRSGQSTRLTPWRNGLSSSPGSFSPDGTTLLIGRRAGLQDQPSLVAIGLDGGPSTVLAQNATDGVYSPDGSRIAFVRLHPRRLHSKGGSEVGVETTTDLFTMRSDGSQVRRLTRSPGGIEIWPSWDPSGERLVYTRLKGDSLVGFLGFGDAILQVNADGSCQSTVLGGRSSTAYYGATWQPGPGREAGRIAC